jgi:hypothetical protein
MEASGQRAFAGVGEKLLVIGLARGLAWQPGRFSASLAMGARLPSRVHRNCAAGASQCELNIAATGKLWISSSEKMLPVSRILSHRADNQTKSGSSRTSTGLPALASMRSGRGMRAKQRSYASKRSGFSSFQTSVLSPLAIFSMLSMETFRSHRSTELT